MQGMAINKETIMEKETYVGIDISKAKADVAVYPAGEEWTLMTTEASAKQFLLECNA